MSIEIIGEGGELNREKYKQAAQELVQWVARNAELEAALAVMLMDICLDVWFKCAGPELAMDALDKTMRAKIDEYLNQKRAERN